MSTITHAGGVITPTVIDGYSSTRAGQNIIHDILGRADPDITFRPAKLRTGTLKLCFTDEEASKSAEDAHATGETFTITTDRGTVDMVYVVAGDIARDLDDTTRDAWVLTVAFQEVLA